MGDLTTDRLWNAGNDDCPSPYARMIPGSSAMPRLKISTMAAMPAASSARPVSTINEVTPRRTPARIPIQEILPHPTGDPFTIFQLVGADLLVLGVVCGAATLFAPAWGLPWAALPVFAVLVTLFAFTEGVYKSAEDPYPAGVAIVLGRSTLFAMGLVFLTAREEMRPEAAFTALASSVGSLVLCRRLRQKAWNYRRRKTGLRKTLIVGGGPIGRAIARALRNESVHRATVCGFVDDDLPLSPVVLGRIADLEWLARAEFIDEVILALPGQMARAREAAEIAFRNRLDIRAVPDLPPGPWSDSGIDHIGDVPVVTLHREPLPDAALFLKRVLDVTGAAVGLVLASPLMAIVALLIRWDSAGPIIYSAERTGAKGRRFHCHKFRSMVTNAEHLKEDLRARNQREGPIFKIDDDPRITRIGRILRRYSLDELPQLWNVLRGEMSLVGPRPHPVDEVRHYELHHYRRLDVKPGITGLWQITARDCPSFDLNMHLDLTYIENWNLRLDLRILASTVRVLFAPEGV